MKPGVVLLCVNDDAGRVIYMKLDISNDDAATVYAILHVQAEMQDMRVVESMGLLSRLKRDESNDELGLSMINDLKGQVDVFEEDRDDLRRIADIFKVV